MDGSTGEVIKSVQALSRIEQHQAFKPERGVVEDTVRALSWKIATEPRLYRELIPNPYSPASSQKILGRFPGVRLSDARRALVLAEPEGVYDRNFRRLPRDKQQDELYRQIDSSAEITVRLSQYVNEHAQVFWDLPSDQIYERLTMAAFGTPDLREVEERYAQSQRRGFRLSVVNFIEDLGNLKPYRVEFAADPKAAISRIFGQELEGSIEVECLPVGLVVYLDETAYKKLGSIIGEIQWYLSSNGATFSASFLPPELRGKIAVINKGGEERSVRTPEQIRNTRAHELRHILFSSFLAEGGPIHWNDTAENMEQLHFFEDHQDYAKQLSEFLLYHAKDEVIAYCSSSDNSYRKLSAVGGNQWLQHLEEVRNRLWIQGDMGPEEKALIYDQYHAKFVSYVQQGREYQWIAHQLFQTARAQERAREQRGDVLTVEKAEALLQNTVVGKARRLGVYFGVKPDGIPRRLLEEQQELAKKFTAIVDELTASRTGGQPLGEQCFPWFDRLFFDESWQVLVQYPEGVLPALIKVIKGANNDFVVEECISATAVVLYVNQHQTSLRELSLVRTALESMLTKRTSGGFGSARTRAQDLLRAIDEVYIYGGVDFIHHKPLGADVAQIAKTEEGQEPSR